MRRSRMDPAWIPHGLILLLGDGPKRSVEGGRRTVERKARQEEEGGGSGTMMER